MAEVNKVVRIGDTLTNLIDSVTKKSVNYIKVTNWYDGTPMTDAKVDGRLYRKKGTEYFREVIDKDGELFLEKDTMAQMRALTAFEILLLKVGVYKGVKLNGYYTEGDTPYPIEYFLSESMSVDDGGAIVKVNDLVLEHKFLTNFDSRYFGVNEQKTSEDNTNFTNKALVYAGLNNIGVINTVSFPVTVINNPRRGGIVMQSNSKFFNQATLSCYNPNNYPSYGIIGSTYVDNIEIVVGNVVGDRDTNTASTGEWGNGVTCHSCNNVIVRDGNITKFT